MEQNFSFKKYAWAQFKKNKPALFSLYLLFALILIAILAPFLANDQPLYCQYKGESFYPAFSTIGDPNKKVVFKDGEELQFDLTDWRRDRKSVV